MGAAQKLPFVVDKNDPQSIVDAIQALHQEFITHKHTGADSQELSLPAYKRYATGQGQHVDDNSNQSFVVGFKPSFIRITAYFAGQAMSWGVGTNNPIAYSCMEFLEYNTTNAQISNKIMRLDSASSTLTATIVSFDDNGFTLGFAGFGAGKTAKIQWEAFR